MLKKITACYLALLITLPLSLSLHAKSDSLPMDDQFHLVNTSKKKSYHLLATFDSYSAALQAFTQKKPKYYNLGIIYNKTFLQVESGAVAFNRDTKCSINTSYTVDKNATKGYLNSCYGNDGAFLDYDDTNQSVKFIISGVIAWAKLSDLKIYPFDILNDVSHFEVQNNTLYHHIKADLTSKGFANSLRLDEAPSYLSEKQKYYSYDTHYFYDNYQKMIEDYRNKTNQQAINADRSYYNYYQYMSHRSQSAYEESDIKKYFRDTLQIHNTINTFQDQDNYIHDILTQSLLPLGSTAFFQYQNMYGSNAIMMLALAMNESAFGRSYLSYTRNNLFGHAAFDSAVEENASRYTSVSSSVYSHALHYISTSYLYPEAFQYYGGFFGNKKGGMNVQYASDPYWGEKAAQYFYSVDLALNFKEKNRHALAICKDNGFTLYATPNKNAQIIDTWSKGYEASFIILKTINNTDGTYYQIQNDGPLNTNKSLQEDGTYSFTNSVAYLKENDILNILNQKQINTSQYVSLTFNGAGGTFYPDQKQIVLQVEKNSMPSIIPPIKDHALFLGWDIALSKATNDITYNATYKNVDHIELIDQMPSSYDQKDELNIAKTRLKIIFEDQSSKIVPITTDMIQNFDTSSIGKKTVQVVYAGTSVPFEINVSDTKKQTQQKLIDRTNYIINSYANKDSLVLEALAEVKRLKNDIQQQASNPLTFQQQQIIDKILIANMDSKLSICISDNKYDLQLSGIYSTLTKATSFWKKLLPRTIQMHLSTTIPKNHVTLLKKVAKANDAQIQDFFTIDGSDNFEKLKLKDKLLISLKKPKQKNYRIYEVNQNDVHILNAQQSKNRITFSADPTKSFALIYIPDQDPQDGEDKDQNHTRQNNGFNYITLTKILCLIVFVLLITFFIIIFILKKRNQKLSPLKRKR